MVYLVAGKGDQMEVVLGALIEWLHKSIKNVFIRWFLVIVVFLIGCLFAYIEWFGR